MHTALPKTDMVIAPTWRRLAALTYDTFILLALSFGYGALMTAGSAILADKEPNDYQPMFNNIVFFCGWMLTLASFYTWFWWRGGQTIGMKTWRIKLICSETSGPVPFPNIVVRMAAGIPCLLLLGIGYWYRLSDKNGDCLHDVISKTRVVSLTKEAKNTRPT